MATFYLQQIVVVLVALMILAWGNEGVVRADGEVKLASSDATAEDHFGRFVAVDRDTIIVAARHDDDAGEDSGSAYMFRRQEGVWVEHAKLVASDAGAGNQFGSDVALEKKLVVIGARYDDDMGERSGSAYVFYWNGSEMIQQAKLTASDGARGDQFGRSVAISGDTIVVGARYDDDNDQDSGSVYVFQEDSGIWTEEAKLTASDGARGDQFGRSVAINGDTIAVGARYDDDNDQDSGSVYVFQEDSGIWTEEAKLTASDGTAGDVFGVTVSLGGKNLAVGASKDFDTVGGSGSVYMFRKQNDGWVEQAKLDSGAIEPIECFGFSVSVSEDMVAIGSGEGCAVGESAPVVVFKGSQGVWREKIRLVASDTVADDDFGFDVAISQNTVVVGSHLDDDYGQDSGSAYVFDLTK